MNFQSTDFSFDSKGGLDRAFEKEKLSQDEGVISNFVVDTERTPAQEKPLQTNQLVSTLKFNSIEVRVCYFYIFYKQRLFLSSTCCFFSYRYLRYEGKFKFYFCEPNFKFVLSFVSGKKKNPLTFE